jgi:hypothetical protein
MFDVFQLTKNCLSKAAHCYSRSDMIYLVEKEQRTLTALGQEFYLKIFSPINKTIFLLNCITLPILRASQT